MNHNARPETVRMAPHSVEAEEAVLGSILNSRDKTHLAAAIVNALLARSEPTYFENVPELLDYLRAGYNVQAVRISSGV